MKKDMQKILITKEQLEKRVAELGAQINKDYANEDSDLIMICILKGSVFLFADLAKLPRHEKQRRSPYQQGRVRSHRGQKRHYRRRHHRHRLYSFLFEENYARTPPQVAENLHPSRQTRP